MYRLGAQQLAYLSGAERLAVYTALGGLRASGAIGIGPGRTLVQTGALPPGVTPLDSAVYHAAGQRVPAKSVASDPGVTAATTRLREGLQAEGLATTDAQRRAARRWAWPALVLLAISGLRLLEGFATDRTGDGATLGIIATGLLTVHLWSGIPHRTRAASTALTELRGRHPHLAPERSPSYVTYGAAAAAMGVALYGTATLYTMDPAFAADAEVQRVTADGGGGSSGTSCGSDSSCGGGGGCGGGCGGCGG